jgi:hypothetical protein
MIEPTETETLDRLEDFARAMEQIAREAVETRRAARGADRHPGAPARRGQGGARAEAALDRGAGGGTRAHEGVRGTPMSGRPIACARTAAGGIRGRRHGDLRADARVDAQPVARTFPGDHGRIGAGHRATGPGGRLPGNGRRPAGRARRAVLMVGGSLGPVWWPSRFRLDDAGIAARRPFVWRRIPWQRRAARLVQPGRRGGWLGLGRAPESLFVSPLARPSASMPTAACISISRRCCARRAAGGAGPPAVLSWPLTGVLGRGPGPCSHAVADGWSRLRLESPAILTLESTRRLSLIAGQCDDLLRAAGAGPVSGSPTTVASRPWWNAVSPWSASRS